MFQGFNAAWIVKDSERNLWGEMYNTSLYYALNDAVIGDDDNFRTDELQKAVRLRDECLRVKSVAEAKQAWVNYEKFCEDSEMVYKYMYPEEKEDEKDVEEKDEEKDVDVKKNYSRMNHINRSKRTKNNAPNLSFVVGNLAFATYEKESYGKVPCEIVGYWNGQFVVRWIDPRRFDTVARKWIVYDSEAHKKYKKDGTRDRLSDFLKDEVVAIGNKYLNKPVSGYRYRDYIELIDPKEETASLEDAQPTDVLVPTFYHKVAEDYKNPSQLKTWNAMKYESAFAPSRHWKTGNPKGKNKPSNPKFQDQTKELLDTLEMIEEHALLSDEFAAFLSEEFESIVDSLLISTNAWYVDYIPSPHAKSSMALTNSVFLFHSFISLNAGTKSDESTKCAGLKKQFFG